MFWKIPNKIKFILFLLFIILFLKSGNFSIPLFFIVVGGGLNFTTIAVNGWKMPAKKVPGHHLLSPKNAKFMDKEEAKLWFLSDIHYHFSRLISKGDFLIFFGLILSIILII